MNLLVRLCFSLIYKNVKYLKFKRKDFEGNTAYTYERQRILFSMYFSISYLLEGYGSSYRIIVIISQGKLKFLFLL